MSGLPLPTITEDDLVDYLVNTPDFFVRHAKVLAEVRLINPHGSRAVSLAERQSDLLREKIRALESRLLELLRHGSENDVLHQRLLHWMQGLLQTREVDQMPLRLTELLVQRFMVPQVSLRLWGVRPLYEAAWFATKVDSELVGWAQELDQPRCGAVPMPSLLDWFNPTQEVQSMVVIPLRICTEIDVEPASSLAGPVQSDQRNAVFGLLVLASPDPQRFHENMATDLVQQLGALASAALMPLLEPGS